MGGIILACLNTWPRSPSHYLAEVNGARFQKQILARVQKKVSNVVFEWHYLREAEES